MLALVDRLLSSDIPESFTPYQLILGSLTMAYALRHLDDLLGIGGELRRR